MFQNKVIELQNLVLMDKNASDLRIFHLLDEIAFLLEMCLDEIKLIEINVNEKFFEAPGEINVVNKRFI